MNEDSDITTEPAPPWLASIPLEPSCQSPALVIVHPGRAVVPPEGLKAVLRFNADGRGGWVSAAQADNSLWGYIDGEGCWRVPPTRQNARNFSEDGLARFCDGGRWGFVDLAGAVVIPPTFDNAHPFRNGVSAVQVGQDAWRPIDREGQPTSDEVFHELGLFGANGLARATLWKKDSNQRTQGFVDRAGRWVIEPRFRDAKPFGESPTTAASLDGERYGLINARGDWVLKPHYPRIDAFNSDGLAYFDEPNAWDNGHGYLDARGKVVVKGGSHLSRRMVCGVVANSYDGTVFLTAEGKPLPGPRLSYGSDFSAESGFAVVRTAAQGPSACATWGLLHPDGRFVPAPAHLLEPLTNGDGWLVGNTPDTPLAPFLTRDGQLAYIDGEGVVVWRAHYDGQQVALLGAEGAPLWRSGVRENCWPPRPFFHAPLTDHLEGLDTLDGIVPLASRLLAQAETRLHQLAAGDMLQADRAGTEKDDDGTDDEEEADDPDQVQADRAVVVRRVMRAYLSESHNGPYEFLSADLHRAVDEARVAMVQRLSARFGPADPDPEHAAPWHRSGDHTQAWALPLARPLPGDGGVLRESREQWLTLYQHADSGDGDAWWELWLMAAPSVDALQLAQRARSAQPAPQAQTADETTLMAQLQSHPRTLADVPRERITHAMVDAALTADEDTVRFVPRRLMTPARYATALRQGVKSFAQMPAGMLSEDACIAHVQDGGGHLEQVPETLRTVAVCAHALRRSPSALEHVPESLRAQAREAMAQLPPDAQEEDPPRAGGDLGDWLSRRVVGSALRGQDTTARRLQHKGFLAAFVMQEALTAKSDTPPTLRGMAGWFEQRPVLALVAHLLLSLAALVGHAFVSVAAWRAEGPWIGLGTFALMGFAELYWAWRFVASSPWSPWLALAATLVVVYVFGWRRLYRRVGLAYAAREDITPVE